MKTFFGLLFLANIIGAVFMFLTAFSTSDLMAFVIACANVAGAILMKKVYNELQ